MTTSVSIVEPEKNFEDHWSVLLTEANSTLREMMTMACNPHRYESVDFQRIFDDIQKVKFMVLQIERKANEHRRLQ